MNDLLLKLYLKMQNLREENGQDLIEYALLSALVALAAVAGMQTLANGINKAFANIGSVLTTYAT